MYGVSVLISFFCMLLFSFSSATYQRDCLSSSLYSCFLCHRLVDDGCLGLFLVVSILFHWSTFLDFCCCLFRATPTVYWGSQARGQIKAVAVSLHHSHSHNRSEPHLQTNTIAHGNTRSLTHWARPGIQPAILWFLVRFVNHWATWWELPRLQFW